MARSSFIPDGRRWHGKYQNPERGVAMVSISQAESLIDAIVERHERGRDEGEEVSVSELCNDHPELKEDVADRIRVLRSMDRLLGIDGDQTGAGGTEGLEALSSYYQIGIRLGSGAFGTVYRAVDLNSNRPVAIKIIESGNHEAIRREAEIQRTVASACRQDSRTS